MAKNTINRPAVFCAGLFLLMLLPPSVHSQAKDTLAGSLQGAQTRVKLLTLDPGHFHAALVQKSMYPVIDPVVNVYAPPGPDLESHLALIRQYNERPDQPTHWVEQVYQGADYLEKMIRERKGNVVVMAGNNRLKTHYIDRAIQAGFHVLSDKPMAIDEKGFHLLVAAFATAKRNKVLLYDIMTERSEITNILQREIMRLPGVFGTLEMGSEKDPSVEMESTHFYYKNVSGKALTRPDWFFDPAQQGEALADVGTHLIDLVQWIAFPETSLDYQKDIGVVSASTWPTPLSLSQFRILTKKQGFPGFLRPYLKGDTLLGAHGNGAVTYRIRGIYTRIRALWAFQAPEGSGDVHHALFKGTKARLEIRQGAPENYRPTLYIFPVKATKDYTSALQSQIRKLALRYPGISLQPAKGGFSIAIPEKYKLGHEAHFAQVMDRFLVYLRWGTLPDWEVKGMLAKYYTSTKALEMATERKADALRKSGQAAKQKK
ncbi:MAG: putative oxidoreductase C-terminal domain-containing protein [Flavisolibacter sp.]